MILKVDSTSLSLANFNHFLTQQQGMDQGSGGLSEKTRFKKILSRFKGILQRLLRAVNTKLK
jgi:hypothetical protein